jgi:hypothetical protein
MTIQHTRKALIYTHLGLGDMIIMNGAVRYIATQYDEIVVICKRKYEKEVSTMYSDNRRIYLCVVEDDSELHPWSLTKDLFQEKGYTVLGCGWFSGKERPSVYDLPYSFYDDLGVPREYLQSYFAVPRTQPAVDIANMFTVPYVVVHEESSIVKIPIMQTLREQGETRLLLDLNKNVYSKDTYPTEWALAEQVVNIPLFNLVCVLEKAEELHMIESSVYCLATLLDLSAVKKKVVYTPEMDGLFTTTDTLHVFTVGPRLQPYEYRSKV